MSDSNFITPYSVIDGRLALADNLDYAVLKGASEVTVAKFTASSESNTSHQYVVQIPSRTTVVSRRVMWSSTIELTLTALGVPATYTGNNRNLVNIGVTDSMSPMPLNNSMSSIQCTCNSNTITLQMQDILPQLLRMNNKNDLLAYNGTTPTAYDTFFDYAESSLFVSNPLGGINNSPDEDINFRGSYPVILGASNMPAVGTAPNPLTLYEQKVTFTVSEPLLLSPFMFGQPQNEGGMFGINNLAFLMNVGNLNRIWRHAKIDTGNTATDRNWNINVSAIKFSGSALTFNFLTLPDSVPLPPRCVVPYYDLNRISLSGTQSALVTANEKNRVLQSNAITIQQIPDKFIICVRKQMTSQTCQDSDNFWPVKAINMTWNNKAGICSGWGPVDFYNAARQNGSNQSWLEFCGEANATNTTQAGGINTVKTSGSLIVLELGKDIPLGSESLAPGCSGTYGLQFSITVDNPYNVDIVPEIILISLTSGVFKLENGSSELKTALLLPSQVVDANKEPPVSRSDLKRMVGDGFIDSLKTAWKRASPYVKRSIHLIDAVAGDGLSASGLSASGMKRKSLKDRLKY